MIKEEKRLQDYLAFLYGKERAPAVAQRLSQLMDAFRQDHPEWTRRAPAHRVSERDAILITYGDMVQQPGAAPLRVLAEFLDQTLRPTISSVHILPFFPFSSDDGFSVIDYTRVDPNLGTWQDVSRCGKHFRLMFDAVINHISARSSWFRKFLEGDPAYAEYFIAVEPNTDLSSVFRPRSSPLLTPFDTCDGEKFIWTTFSADQIDLNYRNPDVLLEVIRILLKYVDEGAEFIRLDAVTFLWKEFNTSCANLPQTHCIVQLLRAILDLVAPYVTIITETNIPHKDNIAYFGDGTNEAQMVYNFALPLLTAHSFYMGNAETLSAWAATLDPPSPETSFFNFLAGHDGIGIQPVRDILSQHEIQHLLDHALEQGGQISYKRDADGSLSPYEINISYFDMLSGIGGEGDDRNLAIQRFLTAHAMMFALRGVPGIYFHSLFGSRNWSAGVEQTGRARTINREKLIRAELESELADEQSLRFQVFHPLMKMLQARAASSAFHPAGGQEVLQGFPSLFALIRSSIDKKKHVLCLHNIANQPSTVSVSLEKTSMDGATQLRDLISGNVIPMQGKILDLTLEPHQFRWLQEE